VLYVIHPWPKALPPGAGQTTPTSPVPAAKNNIYVTPRSYPSSVLCQGLLTPLTN